MNTGILGYQESRTNTKKRKQILKSAQGLFLRNGIDGTSMMMIAYASDVTRRTVYNYYDSKDDIAVDLQILNMEKMDWFGKFIYDMEYITTEALMELSEEILLKHRTSLRFIRCFDNYFTQGNPSTAYKNFLHKRYTKTAEEMNLIETKEQSRLRAVFNSILISYLQRMMYRTEKKREIVSENREELELLIVKMFEGLKRTLTEKSSMLLV